MQRLRDRAAKSPAGPNAKLITDHATDPSSRIPNQQAPGHDIAPDSLVRPEQRGPRGHFPAAGPPSTSGRFAAEPMISAGGHNRQNRYFRCNRCNQHFLSFPGVFSHSKSVS